MYKRIMFWLWYFAKDLILTKERLTLCFSPDIIRYSEWKDGRKKEKLSAVTPFCCKRAANSHQRKNWAIIEGRIVSVAYFPQLEYHQNISDWSPENILIGQRLLLDHQGNNHNWYKLIHKHPLYSWWITNNSQTTIVDLIEKLWNVLLLWLYMTID